MLDKSKGPTTISAELLLRAQAALGEGCIWHHGEQRLYWVDIDGCSWHIYDPKTGIDQCSPVPSKVGTVVPVENGDVLVPLQNGIHQINLANGELSFLVNPITSANIRFNDGKCDPSGRFWVGTIAMDGTPGAAALYRLDWDGSLHEMLQKVTISNGIVWTSDRRTMYYNDTPTQCVQGFDYDNETGNISSRRIAIQIPETDGSPDGMTIDAEDKLWIAMWGAGSVNRYDPITGDLLLQIILPAPNVSSCAFGGTDLKTLFITTARAGLTEAELIEFPLSGDLFYVHVNVPGVPANFYKPA
jgi:sugar lactone lactonase YvrE